MWEWRTLEEWEINDLNLPDRRNYALLDEQGNVTMVGHLLVAGPDNHWLVEPVAGDLQYAKGTPALDGLIDRSFEEHYLRFQPRKDRVEAAEALLEQLVLLEDPNNLGMFDKVRRCSTCKGYELEARIWITKPEQRVEGYYYLSTRGAEELIRFLRPDRGLCPGHHR